MGPEWGRKACPGSTVTLKGQGQLKMDCLVPGVATSKSEKNCIF